MAVDITAPCDRPYTGDHNPADSGKSTSAVSILPLYFLPGPSVENRPSLSPPSSQPFSDW